MPKQVEKRKRVNLSVTQKLELIEAMLAVEVHTIVTE